MNIGTKLNLMKKIKLWCLSWMVLLLGSSVGEAIANDIVRMTWQPNAGSTYFYFQGTKNTQFTIDWGGWNGRGNDNGDGLGKIL